MQAWGWNGSTGHNDYIDFGSFTSASKVIDYVDVTGFSFIDGLPMAVLFDDATKTAAVAWTYDAWFYGYGQWHVQIGDHVLFDTDPGYPNECGCVGGNFGSESFHLEF